MMAKPHQKRVDVGTTAGSRDAFDDRLNDIVKRAVAKVAENARQIIAAEEQRGSKRQSTKERLRA